MNLLLLLTDLFDTSGGIQTSNRCLVKALDQAATAHNWGVKVFVLNDRGESELAPRYMAGYHQRYHGFSGNRLLFVSMGLLESRRADIVILGHVHFAPLAPFMGKATRFLVVYGIDVWKRLTVFEQWGLSRISKIWSISQYTRDRMAELNHLKREQFKILPCTLDPLRDRGVARGTRESLGLPDGRMILTVSRLEASERYKNIDLAIRSIPAVLAEAPDAFYVVVGDGTDRGRLEQIARNLGVQDKVLFRGRVADELLSSYYQTCDLFVLSSVREGFGIVLLEAMCHGKPCVAARAGGLPEVVEDGRTGTLVDPGDEKALTRAMVDLLADAQMREAMGRAAQKRFREELSFDRYCERLGKILCV